MQMLSPYRVLDLTTERGFLCGQVLGDLGADTRTRAEQLHDSMGARAEDTVLVAVSPGQRVVEVVTGGKVADRGAVFAHKGRCYRSGITFNSGLKRYLWVQIIPGTEGKKTDTRFEGGFGIYDAPEPWGPWTTVYFTEKWDVGPGDTSSFPTKWMSADGRTLYLVFSGNDNFSVRKANLTLTESK